MSVGSNLGGIYVRDAQPRPSRWTAELERRLIEMLRREQTLEEIARELSLPPDEIDARIQSLGLGDYHPYEED